MEPLDLGPYLMSTLERRLERDKRSQIAKDAYTRERRKQMACDPVWNAR